MAADLDGEFCVNIGFFFLDTLFSDLMFSKSYVFFVSILFI